MPRAVRRLASAAVMAIALGHAVGRAADVDANGDEGSSAWKAVDASLRADPRWPALKRELETARVEALGRVEKRLGIAPGKTAIAWIAVASPDDTARVRAATTGFHAGWTRVEAAAVVVRLPAYRYLARPAKVRRVVVHEAAHAVLASRLRTRERFEAVPFWLREGLALWVAGEGPQRVRDRVALTALGGRPSASFLVGVEVDAERSARHALPTYAECWLAVRWIESALGADGVRHVSRRVAAADDAARVVAAAVGVAPAALVPTIFRDSRRHVRKLLPAASEAEFRAAVVRFERGDHAAAREAFKALLAAGRAPALDDTLRYLIARTRVESGAWAVARDAFERALQRPDEGLWEPEVLEQLGRCRDGVGDVSGARRAWEEALERFPEDERVASSVRRRLEVRDRPGPRSER